MPKPFDLLVFDWDGTLMDSAAAIAASLQAACGDIGLPVPATSARATSSGLACTTPCDILLPDLPPAIIRRWSSVTGTIFCARDAGTAVCRRGRDAPRTACGRDSCSRSPPARAGAGSIACSSDTGAGRCFHATRCGEEGAEAGPGMLDAVMDGLGVSPERTLMIGDTTHDLQMAEQRRRGGRGRGLRRASAYALDGLQAADAGRCIARVVGLVAASAGERPAHRILIEVYCFIKELYV